MLVNKICPNCKTEQKGLNLKETNFEKWNLATDLKDKTNAVQGSTN